MFDARGIGTLMIMGLGAIVAALLLGIMALVGIWVPIPGWAYAGVAGACLVVSYIAGQRLE